MITAEATFDLPASTEVTITVTMTVAELKSLYGELELHTAWPMGDFKRALRIVIEKTHGRINSLEGKDVE